MENLASIITKKAVIAALEKEIKRPTELRGGTKFQLIYKGRKFPPKEVVRMAAKEIGIKKLSNYRLNGGPPTNDYLIKLGFEVEKFQEFSSNSPESKKIVTANKISRICWNTNGWKKPSGKRGKSKLIKAHENTFGYGHEEWLLDFTKIIGGYHYASLTSIYKHRDKYVGNSYNILLYTVNSETKEKFWIGELKNVMVISKDEAAKIVKEYKRNRWTNEMLNDLKMQELDSDSLKPDINEVLFNIKFKPEDYHPLPYPVLVDSNENAITSYYYVLLNRTTGPTSFEKLNGEFIIATRTTRGFSPQSNERNIEPQQIQISQIHSQISIGLEKELKKKHPKVVYENSTGFGTRIDLLSVNDNSEVFFYEIKTYDHILTCIRMALGQLIEYCYYPTKKIATKLYIVSQHIANENEKAYIEYLRKETQLPIHYMCFDYIKGRITQEI